MNDSTGDEWGLEPNWSDHLELAEKQAPKGLQNHAKTWMQPDTLSKVTASLTQLDQFFWKICQKIEQAVLQNSDEENDHVSTFLDTTIQEVIRDWLGPGGMPFYIFPDHEGEEDEFSDAKMIQLIRSILTGVQAAPITKPPVIPTIAPLPAPAPISMIPVGVPPVAVEAPVEVRAAPPPAPTPAPIVAAPPVPTPAPVVAAPPAPTPIPVVPSQDLSGAKPFSRLRASLAQRRRTLRANGRRALTPVRMNGRGKTRRAKPISPVSVAHV